MYVAACYLGTLAYASHCMLDVSDNRPVAGYITICLAVRCYVIVLCTFVIALYKGP